MESKLEPERERKRKLEPKKPQEEPEEPEELEPKELKKRRKVEGKEEEEEEEEDKLKKTEKATICQESSHQAQEPKELKKRRKAEEKEEEEELKKTEKATIRQAQEQCWKDFDIARHHQRQNPRGDWVFSQGCVDFVAAKMKEWALLSNKHREETSLSDYLGNALNIPICASASWLGGNFKILEIRRKCAKTFSGTMFALKSVRNPLTKERRSMLDQSFLKLIRKHEDEINAQMDLEVDLNFSLVAVEPLIKSCLLKRPISYNSKTRTITFQVCETPSFMYMRACLSHYCESDQLPRAFALYQAMVKQAVSKPSPVFFNGGTSTPQFASCFLLEVPLPSDTIKGLYYGVEQCAKISKEGGGIGFYLSSVRARDTPIRQMHSKSDGIVPFMGVLNATGKYVNQGGKRPGAFACYLNPWHADVFEFLDLKKPESLENASKHVGDGLFYALMISDVFMQQVLGDGAWWLCSPEQTPELLSYAGRAFERKYMQIVCDGRYMKKIWARDLFDKIIDKYPQTGTPYWLFKDAINASNMQQNSKEYLGIVKMSNLCSEIVEITKPNKTAVCNLSSVNVSKCLVLKDSAEGKAILSSPRPKERIFSSKQVEIFYGSRNEKYVFSFELLRQYVAILVDSVDTQISSGKLPLKPKAHNNLDMRPIAIGICGLADLLLLLGISFTGVDAEYVNRKILECMYFASLEKSCDLAKLLGPYKYFQGSPLSHGKFHWNLSGERLKSSFWIPEPLLPVDEAKVKADLEEEKRIEEALKKDPDYRHEDESEIEAQAEVEAEAAAKTKTKTEAEAEAEAEAEVEAEAEAAEPTRVYNSLSAHEKIKLREFRKPEFEQLSTWRECMEQFDKQQNLSKTGLNVSEPSDDRWDWDALLKRILLHGVRNSLTLAMMPTQGTALLLDVNTGCEPFDALTIQRRTLSGEHASVNRYVQKYLEDQNLWTPEVKQHLLTQHSLRDCKLVPPKVRKLFATNFEIPMINLLRTYVQRSFFIDQSSSNNIYVARPDRKEIENYLWQAWFFGIIKTAIYYCFVQAAPPPTFHTRFVSPTDPPTPLALTTTALPTAPSAPSPDLDKNLSVLDPTPAPAPPPPDYCSRKRGVATSCESCQS